MAYHPNFSSILPSDPNDLSTEKIVEMESKYGPDWKYKVGYERKYWKLTREEEQEFEKDFGPNWRCILGYDMMPTPTQARHSAPVRPIVDAVRRVEPIRSVVTMEFHPISETHPINRKEPETRISRCIGCSAEGVVLTPKKELLCSDCFNSRFGTLKSNRFGEGGWKKPQ